MGTHSGKSKWRAKKVSILGHTVSGMGERALTRKFAEFFDAPQVFDVCELLGEQYEPFAKLNYDLADGEHEMLDDLHALELPRSDLMVVLSWCFSVAALHATGAHKKQPTAVKLYAHHVDEKIVTGLYEPYDLLITESLLANERGEAYGIEPGKMLYIPHSYPEKWTESSRRYVEALAKRLGKSVGRQTCVIGTVARFEYGKNCEFAVEAVRRLYEAGEDVVLVLKGNFPEESCYPEFKPRFTEMLEAYQGAPWLLWDAEPTTHEKMAEVYGSCNVILHPSGAEGGSHVIVEALGMGKPVVLLDGSTNPYLFRGLATFVKTTGERRGVNLPFFIPDMDDLLAKLRDPTTPDRAKVVERFHPKRVEERLELLFEPDFEKIAALNHEERKLYGL